MTIHDDSGIKQSLLHLQVLHYILQIFFSEKFGTLIGFSAYYYKIAKKNWHTNSHEKTKEHQTKPNEMKQNETRRDETK